MARVEKLERQMASRLDVSQFGQVTIRQVTELAGQDHERTRKSWAKKCRSCVAGTGERRAVLYDPWRVARVLEEQGIVPRWGALAVRRFSESVAETRKLDNAQREELENLVARWFKEYVVPPEFRGVRDNADRDDIKAQIALNLARHAGEGEGGMTKEEFDGSLASAEATALEWWKQAILRTRNRENPLQARDGDGEDVTGRLDSFGAPGADDS